MPAMIRRRSALLLALSAVAGCAAAPLRPGEPHVLAPGVYMLPGTGGAADEQNLGRIGNSGFIVGESGVLVIDTGTSYLHGQALLAAIAGVTDKPVRLALVTHTRPEFLFGGAAFRERGIPVRMHSRTATLMASRCETCLKTLRQVEQRTAALRQTKQEEAQLAVGDEVNAAKEEVGIAGSHPLLMRAVDMVPSRRSDESTTEPHPILDARVRSSAGGDQGRRSRTHL